MYVLHGSLQRTDTYLVFALFHGDGAFVAGVGGDGLHWDGAAICSDRGWHVCVTHDEDVVPTAEGVFVDRPGGEEHLRVGSGGLAGGRAIVVPDRQVGDRLDLRRQSPARAIRFQPNVVYITSDESIT